MAQATLKYHMCILHCNGYNKIQQGHSARYCLILYDFIWFMPRCSYPVLTSRSSIAGSTSAVNNLLALRNPKQCQPPGQSILPTESFQELSVLVFHLLKCHTASLLCWLIALGAHEVGTKQEQKAAKIANYCV